MTSLPFSRGAWLYGDLLYAHQFEGRGLAPIVLQAQLNDFRYTLHQSVKILSLSMATAQARDRSDIVTILIALDDHCKLALSLHCLILSCEDTQT